MKQKIYVAYEEQVNLYPSKERISADVGCACFDTLESAMLYLRHQNVASFHDYLGNNKINNIFENDSDSFYSYLKEVEKWNSMKYMKFTFPEFRED